MPTYRYEMSKTSRAACQNTVCKKEGPKIQKGELRFGNWADIGDYQGWKWKHWGCVTPLQIGNVQRDLEGLDLDDDDDMNVLDGWDELPAEARDRIRQALKDGHVADEEWKGDVEKNRPGQRGMYLSAKQKREKDAEAEAQARGDDDDDVPDDTPTKPKKGKKIKKIVKEEDDEDELADREETPVPAKRKRGKKVKEERPEESAEEVMPAKKKRAAPQGRKAKPDEDIKTEHEQQALPEPPKKRGRARKEKVKKEEPDEDDNMAAQTDLLERTAVKKEEPADDGLGLADVPENKPAKKSRAKKVKAEPEVDEMEPIAEAKPTRKVRGKKAKQGVKNEPAADEQTDDELAGPTQNGGDQDVKREEQVEEKPKTAKGRGRAKNKA